MRWALKDLEKNLLIGSTLVEGSTLTEKEARQALAGRTVQGHPLSEVRELLNYRSAIEWLISQFEVTPFLSRDLILGFHLRLFEGFSGTYGRWKTHRNYTHLSDGKRHDYLQPSAVEARIRRWIELFNGLRRGEIAAGAARLYYDFEEIHPFEDGNGRVGRILVTYWMHWKGGASWSFYLKDKLEHLSALEAANRGDMLPLKRFFKKRIRKER